MNYYKKRKLITANQNTFLENLMKIFNMYGNVDVWLWKCLQKATANRTFQLNKTIKLFNFTDLAKWEKRIALIKAKKGVKINQNSKKNMNK